MENLQVVGKLRNMTLRKYMGIVLDTSFYDPLGSRERRPLSLLSPTTERCPIGNRWTLKIPYDICCASPAATASAKLCFFFRHLSSTPAVPVPVPFSEDLSFTKSAGQQWHLPSSSYSQSSSVWSVPLQPSRSVFVVTDSWHGTQF